MLVLSRHRHEWIVIGDTIAFVVLEIRGNRVRLGFRAPLGVPIHPQEVYEILQSQQAAQSEHASVALPQIAVPCVSPARFTAEAQLFDLGDGLRAFSRKRDQQVRIGDDILVTIVEIRGDKVRVGLDAPREVSLHRREVYQAIQREKRNASE